MREQKIITKPKVTIIVFCILLFFFFILPAISPSICMAKEKTYQARLGHPFAPDDCWGRQSGILKKYAEKATGGRLRIDVYPAGQLYKSDKEGLEACQSGGAPIAFCNNMELSMFLKKWSGLSLPGMTRNVEHFRKLEKTDAYKALHREFEEKVGLKVLYWFTVPFPCMVYNSKRSLVTPGDWNGLKLRVAPAEGWIGAVKAFGASPIIIDFAETLPAIATGVVDGTLSSAALLTLKAKETMPYCTVPTHRWDLGTPVIGFVVNGKWWNSLPGDMRKAVEGAMPAAAEEAQKFVDKTDNDLWEEYLHWPGVKITYLTEEQSKVWKDLINEKVNRPIAEKLGTVDLLETSNRID